MDDTSELFAAAEGNDWPRVFALLDAGADIHARDCDDNSLLHIAVYAEEEEAARRLLERGADPDAHDACSDTPLHTACDADSLAFVRLLLEHGADPDSIGMQGQTPLFRTASAEVAECLLATGADVNAEDVDGWVPLHCSNEAVTRVLLAHGADVTVGDEAGFTPLFWAESPEKIRLLMEAGARLCADDLFCAAWLRNRREGELAAWLAARGGSIADLPQTPEMAEALKDGRRRSE